MYGYSITSSVWKFSEQFHFVQEQGQDMILSVPITTKEASTAPWIASGLNNDVMLSWHNHPQVCLPLWVQDPANTNYLIPRLRLSTQRTVPRTVFSTVNWTTSLHYLGRLRTHRDAPPHLLCEPLILSHCLLSKATLMRSNTIPGLTPSPYLLPRTSLHPLVYCLSNWP